VNRSVLVVDDEPDIVLMVRTILELEGDSVIEAGTGEQALEVLEREEPDVVLLDIRLPGVDGWAVLERLRESGRLDGLPVLMVSAHSTPSTYQRAEEEGSSGYLTKPFTSDELLSKLEQVVPSAAD
jgi:CheY-like chemotaxis protein